MRSTRRKLRQDWQTSARPLSLSLLVVLVPFVAYVSRRVAQSSDSRWTLHVAASIIQERDVDLDEYTDVIPSDDYRTERSGVPAHSAAKVSRRVLG